MITQMPRKFRVFGEPTAAVGKMETEALQCSSVAVQGNSGEENAKENRLPEILEFMASIQEFRCEICGRITDNPTHWFVIQCGDLELTVLKWNSEATNANGARHFCG